MKRRATPPSIERDQMVKPIDSWWTVLFIDPLATRIVPRLVRHPAITPTRITAFAHLLAIVAIGLFAAGAIVPAAILFEIRFLADCLDGKVARVTGRTSSFGRLFDAFGDRILVTASFAALAWGIAPVAGLVLAGAYPLSHHLVEQRNDLLAGAGRLRRVDETAQSGFGAAMARRRLYPIPTSIELEHLTLFVAPVVAGIVGNDDIVVGALWLAAAWFSLNTLRYFVALLRTAADLDVEAASAGEP